MCGPFIINKTITVTLQSNNVLLFLCISKYIQNITGGFIEYMTALSLILVAKFIGIKNFTRY